MVNIRHPLIGWSISVSTGFFLNLFGHETDRKLIRVVDDFRGVLWPFLAGTAVSRSSLPASPVSGGQLRFDFTFSKPNTKRLLGNILTVFQE